MTAPSDKEILRRRALVWRDGLDPAVRAHASATICASAFDLIAARRPVAVAGYWPIRSEVDGRPLLEQLAGGATTIALPVVGDNATVLFRKWHPGDVLEPAGFGTLGPVAGAEEVLPDTVVLPLAGFDAACHRLGYGRGHYDRALARLHGAGDHPYLVGLAFAGQEVPPIPSEDHDIRLDVVVTERGLRAPGETG